VLALSASLTGKFVGKAAARFGAGGCETAAHNRCFFAAVTLAPPEARPMAVFANIAQRNQPAEPLAGNIFSSHQ